MPASEFPQVSDKAVIGLLLQQMEVFRSASWVDQICFRGTSSQATETYAGVGAVPSMREWLGGKKSKSLREQSITITNKDWESTIAIKTKDLRRDKTGFLTMRAGQLAEKAIEHDAKLVSSVIDSGTGTTVAACYDGKALFADDHSLGDSGTVDNNISVDISTLPTTDHGSTTAPSPAELVLAAMTGIQVAKGFKDDQGEPINGMARSFIVMVPTGLWIPATLAMSRQTLDARIQNPLLATNNGLTIDIITNPYLTWTDKFAIFVTGSASKPLIIQEETGPMVKILGDGSDHQFNEAENLYSVEKSGNVGCGSYDKAVLVTMT